LIKKERSITDYALVLTIVGTLISLFHNYIYIFGEGSAPCDASGVSCVAHYVTFLGYISIPLMALTGFVVTLLVLIARKRNEKALSTLK
jgi:disulfide bond formation protein DsbB